MKLLSPVVLASLLVASAESFSIGAPSSYRQPSRLASASTEEDTTSPLSTLPPELLKIASAFAKVGDDSLRHKQLLYMANSLPVIGKEGMIPENKVPGCLSTVFVDAKATWSDEKEDYVIDYVGESDGLLTKGLVALLVR